jgi:hypothetical protein
MCTSGVRNLTEWKESRDPLGRWDKHDVKNARLKGLLVHLFLRKLYR